MSIRMARLERMVTHALSELVPARVRDPRAHAAEAITITKLKLAPDLTLARVLVSIKASAEVQRSVLSALEGATGYLRRELGRRVRLRRMPELVFLLDKTAESAARIEGILHELALERAAAGGQREEGQHAGAAAELDSPAEVETGPAAPPEESPTSESPTAGGEPEPARDGLESER